MLQGRLFNNHLILSSLTGILLVIAWPPVGLTPLLFFAFVPLLKVMDKTTSFKKTFLYTYLAFFFWTLGTMYWIGNTQLDGQNFIIVSVAFIFIPLFQTIPIVLFQVIKRKFDKAYILLLVPFFWVSYEFLHSRWDLAFTWLHLGLGLSPMPYLIQYYELTGPLGGTLLIWLVNVLVYLILFKRDKINIKPLYVGLASLLVLVASANFLLIPGTPKTSRTAHVAIVQNSTDSYQKLNKETLEQQVALISKSVQRFKQEKIDLVVFPEGFLRTSPKAPLIINEPEHSQTVQRLLAISDSIDAPLLIGFIGFKLHDSSRESPENALPIGDGRYYSTYNGAMFLTPDRRVQIQLKNNLVPFMERVPFLESTSFFEKFRLNLNQSKISYGRDDQTNVFEYEQLKIAPLICLDAVFPAYTTRFIDKRANLVAIIANDSWAGKTSGFLQNAEYAKSVALSLRKTIIRSATTGVSLFVNEVGSVEKETKWKERTTITKAVELNRQKTFYSIVGDLIGYISLIVVIISLSYFFIRR